MGEQLLFRPAQAGEALAISRSRVYELVKAGQLRAVRVGSAIRIPRDALDAFISALPDAQDGFSDE